MNDDIDLEWNLYHDMDNRSYNDVNKIKDLEADLKEAMHEISTALAYLKSCGYLGVDPSEPEFQMAKSFETFLEKMKAK